MNPQPPPLPPPLPPHDLKGDAPVVPPPLPKKKRARWPWVLFFLPLTCLVSVAVGAVISSRPNVPDVAVLKLKLEGPMKDRGTDWLAELRGGSPLTLPDVLEDLRKAAADKRIRAVWVTLENPMLGWAQTEELRDALIEFRKSKKPVLVYAESYDEKAYALALGGDEIYAVPDAPFEFNGLAVDVLHYPGLLEKLGIEVQYFRHGKYKSVSGETFGRKALTEPVKEMINHTLDVQFGLFIDAVAKARKLEPQQVKALIDEDGRRAEWALSKKLIDGIAYADEVEEKLKKRLEVPEKEKLKTVSAHEYRKVRAKDAGLEEGKAKLALIFSQGLVVAGNGSLDPFSGESSQGSTPIIKALKRAVDDDDVKAIVFRVNSPGGAGLGCDLVRREVELTLKKKPVVVSMSDMAASGGYWVSMNASAIVAEPSTYTGSIGIWSVVPNLKGTYENLGLNAEVFPRGAHADEINGTRPLSEAEAESFDAALKASYDRFVELAAQGRKKTHEQMEEIAQGRTWLGKDALEKGLVDKLGGLETAVALAKEKASFTGAIKLEPYEGSKGPWEKLFGDDDESADSSAIAAAWVSAAVTSGVPQPLRKNLQLLSVGRELLEHRETVFVLPELVLDAR